MVKYGKLPERLHCEQENGHTLDESFIDELSQVAHDFGKKKPQVNREALQDYFDVQAVTKTVQEYEMGTLETISHADTRKAFGV